MQITNRANLSRLIRGIDEVLTLPADTKIVFVEDYKCRGGTGRIITIGELRDALEKSNYREDYGWESTTEGFSDFSFDTYYRVWCYEADYQI